jgi:hypothetical protein
MKTGSYDTFSLFNPEVEGKVKQIKEEIDKEKESEAPDKERLSKLAQEIMIQGLKLNVGYIRNYGQLGF